MRASTEAKACSKALGDIASTNDGGTQTPMPHRRPARNPATDAVPNLLRGRIENAKTNGGHRFSRQRRKAFLNWPRTA